MEVIMKLTNWSVSGNVVFEYHLWSCENHSHLVQITWTLIYLMICTFPIVFFIAAAIASDRRLNSGSNFPNFENKKMLITKHEMVRAELQYEDSLCLSIDAVFVQHSAECFEDNKKEDMVRAELQLRFEDPLCLSTDAVYMPDFKYESEGDHSETNPKQVINTLDEMAVHRENTKDSLQKVLPSIGSSLESIPGPLKHQDYRFSFDVSCDSSPDISLDFSPRISWDSDFIADDNFVGIHNDGLHMPLGNGPETDFLELEKDYDMGLQQYPNVMQEEAENEFIFIRMHKESPSEIRKDCSHSSDSEESSVLKGSQRGKKVEQKSDKSMSSSGSQICQRKGRFSTISEDNICNVEKSTSKIDIQIEMAEENKCSIVSRKQKQTTSNPSRGTIQPEFIPTSSSLSHPQQPMIDAENTQYMSPGHVMLRTPFRQAKKPGVDPRPQMMSECPKHPEYAPLSSRINSYTRWSTRQGQTQQQMAEAGFFYAGFRDYTRCFQCGGGLRNWDPGDNPWIEHARWYPQCTYVLGKRGQKFVNSVLRKQIELLAVQNAERNDSNSTTTTSTIRRSGTGTNSKSDSAQESGSQSDQPRYFQNPQENDIANKLIEETEYQQETAWKAIMEVKRRRGQQRITIEHAAELLLADEETRGRAGRQNEAATMEKLTHKSERFTLHADSNPLASPTVKTTGIPQPPSTAESDHGGHPHQVEGARSYGQQQSGQTDQTTGLGRTFLSPHTRQNILGPKKIASNVPLLSPSFVNLEGHQSIKAAKRLSSPSRLEPAALPVLDAESLREEYLRIRYQNICKVCMERNVELAFLPCGHLVCCEVCGQALRICPICQAQINASVRTYHS